MLRPFLVLLLGLATVSSSTIPTTTTLWTKLDQTQKLTCPMPNDGEKLQVCAWRIGDEGAFKSSFKKSHGDRLRYFFYLIVITALALDLILVGTYTLHSKIQILL